jgi:hypothetical protein
MTVVNPGAGGDGGGSVGPQGPPGPTGPQGNPGAAGVPSSWKGLWQIGAAYSTGDGVVRNGSGYVAKASSTGVDPATDVSSVTGLGTKWNLVVLKGADGTGGSGGGDLTNYMTIDQGATREDLGAPFTFTLANVAGRIAVPVPGIPATIAAATFTWQPGSGGASGAAAGVSGDNSNSWQFQIEVIRESDYDTQTNGFNPYSVALVAAYKTTNDVSGGGGIFGAQGEKLYPWYRWTMDTPLFDSANSVVQPRDTVLVHWFRNGSPAALNGPFSCNVRYEPTPPV